MDFFRIKERSTRNGVIEVYPDYKVSRSKDLMVRGKSFYAIWDEERGLWSTDEYDVQRLVDAKIYEHAEKVKTQNEGVVHAKVLGDFSSNAWMQFRNYVSHLSDSSVELDQELTFSNTDVKKTDYVSKKLPYPLARGDISAWDELVGTLYDPEDRAKLEWAIGSIVAGESKYIQKFIVLYGAAGAGKSTILNIIQKLFEGYYTTFEAKALTGNSNAFATEAFKANPMVAIQHDGDLSKIEDNTKLNSIVSHEEMVMNEKYKPSYTSRINAFLFMGTNKPVKITDAKSGIIRRLIDVQPSGRRVPPRRYQLLMSQIDFELGAIAHHCLDIYREMGRDYYSEYKPVEMMLQTDVFYNFIESAFDIFKEQDGTSLKQAHELYKQFCDDSLIDWKLPRYKFREELKNYFDHFEERAFIDGAQVRSWYSGFKIDQFRISEPEEHPALPIILDKTESIFDEMAADWTAQYASEKETPMRRWAEVETTLSDISTDKIHYVKPPLNHIVIDFDLTDDEGVKSKEKNLEAASMWPSTYAEYSKGGAGIHLHYIYDGDPTELSRVYDEGIEVKVFVGDSSLRRRLSQCNDIPVATISSGLPLKEKKMIDKDIVHNEKSLRALIERNIRKEIHPGTKPSIDFIHKILEDAYSSGVKYDLSDMKGKLLAFSNNSTNQARYCLKLVQQMKFASEEEIEEPSEHSEVSEHRIVYFDVEVFPNLFVVCWKYKGDSSVVKMINPSAQEIEELVALPLVGFNNRRYDNHILYGRMMGYNNEQLYLLSKKIITNTPNATFAEAYNISYADIYDYASVKQSVAKWQLELGIKHHELGMDWDAPVDEDKWELVAEYCQNDVVSTEKIADDREQDFVARQILADLSGLPVNATTQRHTARIIFGEDRRPQEKFIYTDLSEMFPGYTYDFGKSLYLDEEVGEGGYVYAEPGMYEDVAVLDIASQHPTSIIELNHFGPYTKNFKALLDARLAIKRGEYDQAKKMLNGVMEPYLKSEDDAEDLSYALKIVINIVYGLTAAKFDNPFRDPRNKDNIVAKRGALFMIDLKKFVQDKGFTVAHIKTDSIKIPNATQDIIDDVMEFGKKYGYDFEHEATYDKFALLNDAVFAALVRAGRKPAYWETVGAQFLHPYVKKTLFTNEPIEFGDYCESRSVTSALYLDFNGEETPMFLEDPMHFVGKSGLFVPVTSGGGLLVREKEGKFHAASGSKGYRWLEAHIVEELELQDRIDKRYFQELVDAAVDNLSKHGDVEWFLS